ncbi:MAG: matrixin family metalloprotease [Deltaproteobacteria bacterium]|nr:matrixin family metalloprotease [Deltaproteobacteria bacterium]
MMKTLFFFTAVFLYTLSVNAFTVRSTKYGELVKWESDEIDVYLSPTLEMLGPSDKVYYAVEDAFYTWLHEADIKLQVNFVYADCEPGYASGGANTNCITVKSNRDTGNEEAGGNASITYSQSSGEIFDGDIVFYLEAGNWKFEDAEDGLDFKHVVLHEVGHFLGLTHSDIDKAVMFPTVNLHTRKVSVLHEDDIYGALALYDTRELEEGTSCQMSPVAATAKGGQSGLWTLLTSLLF